MYTSEVKISRGEVFYIVSNYDNVGSEQRAGRPAVVVSNNLNNEHSRCVEICYLTLQEKSPLPTHVKIDRGECFNSTILCEQITTVSKERIGDYMCRLPDEVMDKVDKALIISLGVDYLVENRTSINLSTPAVNNAPDESKEAQIKELKYHLDCTLRELEIAKESNESLKEKAAKALMYEKMYNDLLDRIMRK